MKTRFSACAAPVPRTMAASAATAIMERIETPARHQCQHCNDDEECGAQVKTALTPSFHLCRLAKELAAQEVSNPARLDTLCGHFVLPAAALQQIALGGL